MKASLLFVVLSALTLKPAISQASFLDEIEGRYRVSGDKCKFGPDTTLTNIAQIESTDQGARLTLFIQIGAILSDMSYHFKQGIGQEKSTTMGGGVVPLPITTKTVWKTDESKQESSLSEYEGLIIPKRMVTSSLKLINDEELILSVDESGADLIECKLRKN